MKKIKKIAVFTGNRAEYGLQYPVLKAIEKHPNLDYQLMVSGAHLDDNFGNTKSEIINIRNIKNQKDNDIVLIDFKNGSYSIIIRDNSTKNFSIDIHSNEQTIERIVFDDNYLYFKNLIVEIGKFANGQRVLKVKHTYNTINALIESKK